MENKVNITIPEEDRTAIMGAMGVLQEKLGPVLQSLTVKERKTIPKMSDGTLPFVEKTLAYAKSDEQFNPPFLKVDEMEVDFNSVKQLAEIFRPLAQISSNLEDTIMLAGSEAYVSALSYYNSVKLASRMNIPGARSIYNDLAERFT